MSEPVLHHRVFLARKAQDYPADLPYPLIAEIVRVLFNAGTIYGSVGLARISVCGHAVVLSFNGRNFGKQVYADLCEAFPDTVFYPALKACNMEGIRLQINLPLVIGDYRRLRSFLANHGANTFEPFHYRFPVMTWPKPRSRYIERGKGKRRQKENEAADAAEEKEDATPEAALQAVQEEEAETKDYRLDFPEVPDFEWKPALQEFKNAWWHKKHYLRYLPEILKLIPRRYWPDNGDIAEAIMQSSEIKNHSQMLSFRYPASTEDELVIATWDIFNRKLWHQLDNPKNIYRLLYRTMETYALSVQSSTRDTEAIYYVHGEDAQNENNSTLLANLGLTEESAEDKFADIEEKAKNREHLLDVANRLRINGIPSFIPLSDQYRAVGRPPKPKKP